VRHHTKDPIKRAEHIADHESKKLEGVRPARGERAYKDWPSYWLDLYSQTLEEFAFENSE
jgi:hypothetical protein